MYVAVVIVSSLSAVFINTLLDIRIPGNGVTLTFQLIKKLFKKSLLFSLDSIYTTQNPTKFT